MAEKDNKDAKKESTGKWFLHQSWNLFQLVIAALLLYYIVNYLDMLIK